MIIDKAGFGDGDFARCIFFKPTFILPVMLLWILSVAMVMTVATGAVQLFAFVLYGFPLIYLACVYRPACSVILGMIVLVFTWWGRYTYIKNLFISGMYVQLFTQEVAIPVTYLGFCISLGALLVSNSRSRERFQKQSGELQQVMKELQKANERYHLLFGSVVQALSAAIDAKDSYTKGHSERVTRFAVSLAQAMGLAEDEIERISYAAALHDLGKIGVNGDILRKPGGLSRDEYLEICRHPIIGAQILSNINFLENVIPLVSCHHEWFNGQGYPNGHCGEEIPLGARIIAVADALDAMTSERPYRPAFSREHAIKELERCSGSQFDPVVSRCILQLMRTDHFLDFSQAMTYNPNEFEGSLGESQATGLSRDKGKTSLVLQRSEEV